MVWQRKWLFDGGGGGCGTGSDSFGGSGLVINGSGSGKAVAGVYLVAALGHIVPVVQ